jgi:hypothetical protein
MCNESSGETLSQEEGQAGVVAKSEAEGKQLR